MEKQDLIIIGTGCAGMSAAIYAARFRLKTLLIGEMPGGLITTTHLVENWPGFTSISGQGLAEELKKHVEANNVPIVYDKVIEIKKKADFDFELKTISEKKYATKTILLATGTERKKLNVPGEKELANKGVSYCATCDGALFKNKVVAVIGGSDSAAKEALFLAEYASKVYIVYRGEKIRAEPINTERVTKNKKIEIITKKNVAEIVGQKKVEAIKFKEGGELKVDGVFIEIGATPNSELAEKLGVKLEPNKEIIIDNDSRTNVKGIYAAGDVTNRHFKQAITGAAEGVIAAFSAYEDISKNK
ncbi:MAG: FAD-dependent oxidoreductase [Candidatus Diapherotrites archaeon]